MSTDSRLDKAINGLKEIVERNRKEDKFSFSSETIIINTNRTNFWGSIIIIMALVLVPLGALIYYLSVDNASLIILISLLVLELLFINDTHKTLKGDTILTINLKEKQFQSENINRVFQKLYPINIIKFSEIEKVDLIEKSISSNNRWLQLVVFDKEVNQTILTNFSTNYPESFVATKVKFLVEVIIWSEKQKG